MYIELNNHEDAKSVLVNLKKQVPEDKDIDEVIYFLAKSEENLNNLESALELYHQLMTRYPNSLLIHKARERARHLNIELSEEQT